MAFEAWLTLAKTLGSALSFLHDVETKKRERVAVYLEGIASSLGALARKASNLEPFAEQCAEIKVHIRKLRETCTETFELEELGDLADDLDRAALSPGALNAQIIFERASDSERNKHVATIQEAAGTFRATAQALRAQ
jgi:hypothetical protein